MDCIITLKYNGDNEELNISNKYIEKVKYKLSIPKINSINQKNESNIIEITGRLTEMTSEDNFEREQNLLKWSIEKEENIFSYYRNIVIDVVHKGNLIRRNKFYFMEVKEYKTDLRENKFKLVLKQKLDKLTWVAFDEDNIKKLDEEYIKNYNSNLNKHKIKKEKQEENINILIPKKVDKIVEIKDEKKEINKDFNQNFTKVEINNKISCKNTEKIGDPFNIVTGSFLIEQCDLVINDILEEVAIERFYESIDDEVSQVGKGWHLSIFSSLLINENQTKIKIKTFDNKIEIFDIIEEEIKNIRNDDKTLSLKKIENRYSLYNNITKQTLIYKENGLLLYVIDKNGNKREYEYEENILKKINFPSGQYLEFKIKDGKIIKIIDNMNRQIKYEYDGDYLISVEIPNGGIERYIYNKQGVIESVINAEGIAFVNNKYDNKNRIIYQRLSTEQEYQVIYDDENRVNTYLLPKMNRETKYIYNKDNVVTKILYQDETYEEKKYDIWENLIYVKDRLGNETRYVYNKNCLRLEGHLANGLSIYYEYDEKNNLIKEFDNAGKESKYEYDEKGNLIKSIAKIDDEREQIVLYKYDKYGRIIKEIDSEGREKTFEYNFNEGQFNKPTKYITSEENVYKYTYDKGGRRQTAENKYGIITFEYDSMNIMTKEIDQLNNIRKYEYDQMFNLKKIILPNNIEKGIGKKYEYDPFHKVLKIEDEEGNIYVTPRDYEGNILKEINPNTYDKEINDGLGISYEYDEYNNKVKVIYPDEAIERIKYDANGNIIKRISPEQYDKEIDDGVGYTYEYDCMNRLIQISDPRHNILKRYVYDLSGNIIKEINSYGYKTGSTDEEKVGILYKYNNTNWLIEKREPVTKYEYRLTTYDYDLSGNIVKENRYVEYQTKDSYVGEIHTISFDYDKDNRRIKVSDCTGAVQEYSYNAFNKIATERRKINNTMWQEIVYNYDKSGRLIEVKRLGDKEVDDSITKYEYDKNGNITRIKTPNGYEIIREYDNIDRLISERHIEKGGINNITKFKYDKASNLIGIIDNNGRETIIEYDLLNREIRRIEKDGSISRKYYNVNGLLSKEIKPEQYNKEDDNGLGYQYNYNPQGQLITIIAPNGQVVQTNSYDTEGRLLNQIDGEENTISFEYDLIGNKTIIRSKGELRQRFEYDARGNIIGILDGEKNHTKYVLDKWGKITQIEKPDGSNEKYTYDYIGNITSSTDGENKITQYIYNISGKIKAIIDPNGEKEQYFYDLEDRLNEKIDRNGNVIQYGYNMYSNLLYRKTKDNSVQEIYKYSKEGYLENAISNGMQYNYTYDIMGRIENKTASGRTLISYEYDKNGNKIKELDITGKVTKFEYNELDLLKKVSYNENTIATYDYYKNGLIKNINNGNLTQQYKYDADLNLSELEVRHNNDLIVSNVYKYYTNGNRKTKQMFDSLTRYFYTEIGQLKKVKSEKYEEELFYDKSGNRTSRIVNGNKEFYNYDNRNRLIKLTKENKTIDFKWDNSGNLLQDDKATYTYNGFNQVIKVETFDGNIQINRYDAEGLRYEMEENEQLIQFIFNTEREVIAEKEDEWTVYIRCSELLASSNQYAKTYYHYANDEMGSCTHIVDNSKILNEYEYDAWGNVVEEKETIKNRFKFNGQQLDPITTQYYLRARFYNPVISRFIQEDTYRGDGLNLYTYCSNNPIYYVDPTGHNGTCQGAYASLRDTYNFTEKALEHIFEGEINRRGAVVGGHYEPTMYYFSREDKQIYVSNRTQPTYEGVYRGDVEINGIIKQGGSTFFPQHWTMQNVINGINIAYENKSLIPGTNKYRGTAYGVTIEMYLDPSGRIATAFPKM
ncbi:EndoU domain-containing protein [[Clostridium] colinum]|uniref:EndoU domain-containing protein n=1 Tax=[Clostridium] colinum TaxID=36835 RepID=UPI0020255551|nr:EndoU domain-containing protein [[Clostridium] colinum]